MSAVVSDAQVWPSAAEQSARQKNERDRYTVKRDHLPVQFIRPPINRFLKSSFGPALLPGIDSRFPKSMPLTIYSLGVPRTLGGGDCVLIYKLLARRKGFSRSQIPILGIEDSRPVIKSRMLAGLRGFFCHTRHVPLRGYSVDLAMGEKVGALCDPGSQPSIPLRQAQGHLALSAKAGP